ncbi:MAG: endo-1,4-beta-xylanase [Puniceicoccales bacterium]
MNSLITQEYERLWDDPKLQERIEEGIRAHRQSDACIRVTDFKGAPIPGVTVTAEQHDSAFHFGANIFKLGDFPQEQLNRDYEDAFCGLFNGATVPFYWRTLEPEQGRPRFSEHSVPISRRPPPDQVVRFCQKRGLRMHGHTFSWAMRKWNIPDWLPEDPAEAAPFWEKRMRELAERYGDSIKRWDIVNEATADFIHLPKFIERNVAFPMQEKYEEAAFEWAGKYMPADNRLDLNEDTGVWGEDRRAAFTDLIKRIQTSGGRLGGIGMQFHFFQDHDLNPILNGQSYTPEHLLKVLDYYGQFELPLHVSEITITAPGNSSEGLETQATLVRNFYRLWFSHPAMEGITWWNMPDGAAAPGENKVYSGLVFSDMSPKPSYLALQNLIRHEWRTRTQGVTDEDGCFRFRGFHGTYRLGTDSGQADAGIESAITLEPGKDAQQQIRLYRDFGHA